MSSPPTQHAEKIRVQGIVQGVGFRPMVWKIANNLQLAGTVSNDGKGVLINIHGKSHSINSFVNALINEKPPLARIDNIKRVRLDFPSKPASNFNIIESTHNVANTGITADAATCEACLADIFYDDKNLNRRQCYPFTNCTHCGPRLSIIRGIPYDRAQTSMDEFELCSACLREYNSPEDRRFHAQPNACPNCGPEVWLEDTSGKLVSTVNKNQPRHKDVISDLPIIQAGLKIREGAIVAIKGIGGIHLGVDACNEKAVEKLRKRKQRPQKPFALMMNNIAMVETYCHVNDEERTLLSSPAAPIVLLEKKPSNTAKARKAKNIAQNVAPNQKTLGVMLPYSPIHHMLLKVLNKPIVLTSGNNSCEPQSISNKHARECLSNIADLFLLHNRRIENRVDDSVVRLLAGKPQFYRRARGYAPEFLPLPEGFEDTPQILAMGGELKNTFCLIKKGQAILSQHMGDLENYKTYEDYRHNLTLYEKLFQHQAQHIVIDAHPEYISNKAGQELAKERNVKLHIIQHHHAHIAACLADNHYPLDSEPVIGIILDGLGYGGEATNNASNEANNPLWGGEFLLADYQQSQRLAHFKPVALLGGAIAMKQPWRNTYAHLQTCLNDGNGWDWIINKYPNLALVRNLSEKPLATFDTMLEKNLSSPKASSAGRLFDAVAGAIGICTEEIQYEGQAAIELENCINHTAWKKACDSAYPFNTDNRENQLDPAPMWKALLNDLSLNTPVALISSRFHKGLSYALQSIAVKLATEHNIKNIILSGGVFQNKTLFEDVKQGLEQQNFSVLAHQNVPANDGGIALGQALITAARLTKRTINRCKSSYIHTPPSTSSGYRVAP